MTDEKKPSFQEGNKIASKYLKGVIAEELADSTTPFVSEGSYELLKFHGSYQGYNRDTATARKQQKLEKEYEFMVRAKIPAGRLTADQYLALDAIAGTYANSTLRITTRETFQFHCIVKGNLKAHIAAINAAMLSTLGGCGDVVRNILACPAPIKDNIHHVLERDAFALAAHVAPKTRAYHEIWMDGENVTPASSVIEPLYGETYLPRKFKIALSDPEDNCVDVLANDLAFIGIFKDDELIGYNVALGGGLGMTHNKPNTYARLATPVSFITPDLLLPAAEAAIKLHRDYGDRSDRKHARLKYVVQENGPEWTKKTFDGYLGRVLPDPVAMPKFAVIDHLGWHEQGDGKWFLGVPVSSGRIIDRDEEHIRTGLHELIKTYKMRVILTADQNIILCDIEQSDKEDITRLLKKHGIKLKEDLTRVYQNFLACVALPTCGKALAEAERVKLPLVAEIEKVLAKHKLLDERISIRIAGCPNGCSRPTIGDIGIVGRTPDSYVLSIGGDFEGTRLNKPVFDKVPLKEIPEALNVMFADYAAKKQDQEGFGDFCQRVGIDTLVAHTKATLKDTYKWAAA